MNVEIQEWVWKRILFPEAYYYDDRIDGVLYLLHDNARDMIAFSTTVPEEGGEEEPYGVWHWDGDKDEPTLSPSINLRGYHVTVEDGELIDCS